MNSRKSSPSFVPQTPAGLGELVDRSLNYRTDPDGNVSPSDGPDIGLLVLLNDFVRASLETDLAPFLISRRTPRGRVLEDHEEPKFYTKTAEPNSASRASLILANLRQAILSSAAMLDPIDRNAAQLLYAPHLRLVCDVFLCHPISARLNCNGSSAIDVIGLTLAELYNDFVAVFRRVFLAKRSSLSDELHNWRLSSKENVVNVHAYLDGQFARPNSVTVLHLRLFHARERVNLVSASVEDQHRDLGELKKCREVFLDRMRGKRALFTKEPGYVWSILPSLEGGYSLHVTLLFDTAALQKVLDDRRVEAEQAGKVLQDHADQIGAYWVKVGTRGRGNYLRADQHTWLYDQDWVHGEVHAIDFVRREKLKKTLGYLAMRRALLRLKNEPKGEYFGMRNRKPRAQRQSVERRAKRG